MDLRVPNELCFYFGSLCDNFDVQIEEGTMTEASERPTFTSLTTFPYLLTNTVPIDITYEVHTLDWHSLWDRQPDPTASVMASGRTISFQSRTEASLTCRHWLLDPSGCLNHQCRYSHMITGALSPPSMFACYAYNNGGCLLPQDQCLFAHLTTGPGNQYLQIRRE